MLKVVEERIKPVASVLEALLKIKWMKVVNIEHELKCMNALLKTTSIPTTPG